MKPVSKITAIALAISLGALFLTGCDKNKSGASGDHESSIAVINKITQNRFNISSNFAVKGHHMTGYVAEPKEGGQPVIFYSNNQTGDIVYGMLFDKDGTNLTEKYVNKHISPMLAKQMLEDVSAAKWFLIGKESAPHQVYVIGEPNCSACHALFADLKPFVDKGELSIRWIMTAFLKPDSLGKAAAILQADDPAAMLSMNEGKGFDMKKEEGPVKVLPEDQIQDKTKAALKANMLFMAKSGVRGTPAFFYVDNDGKPLRVDGHPQGNFDALIKTMGKLPASKSENDAVADMPVKADSSAGSVAESDVNNKDEGTATSDGASQSEIMSDKSGVSDELDEPGDDLDEPDNGPGESGSDELDEPDTPGEPDDEYSDNSDEAGPREIRSEQEADASEVRVEKESAQETGE